MPFVGFVKFDPFAGEIIPGFDGVGANALFLLGVDEVDDGTGVERRTVVELDAGAWQALDARLAALRSPRVP